MQETIFSKIIRKEVAADIVYEDPRVIAFKDIAPIAPYHILVIPKQSYVSYDSFVKQASDEEQVYFFKTVQKIAARFDLDKTGYRLITNHGADSGQEVPHFHVHILGGKRLGGLG
jgi:diadenosine tetraphosphate (Ap4A) HIT family hydrolase